jgi:predicted esterase
MGRSLGVVLVAAVTGLGALCTASPAASLYSGRGPRPGPDILYAPPAVAPQLTNAGPWKADPILVSGASAYRQGEFLYQDFLYDDHGAREQRDPGDPRAGADTFSMPNGTYTYPTDRAYASNAADLVEFRVRPLADATAFRVTLNTLKDPSLVAFSVAIGGTDGVALPFPKGANVRAPADLFLTVYPARPPSSGMVAELVHATTGLPVSGGAATVAVDTRRRQIEVRVPHGAWNPGTSTVRLAAGVGLWDKGAGTYLAPRPAADATHPGGAGTAAAPPAFFNVAFRGNEPYPEVRNAAATATNPAWWRDAQQGAALASGDISTLHADVDFGRLASGVSDDSGVPKTGPIDRILASHYETAQGVDHTVNCLTGGASSGGINCPGQYQGNLQPYAIYVPKKTQPAAGWGMTLLLHSLGAPYNQFAASVNQSQFGERGPGSITLTPESRGPDGFYDGIAGAEVFEAWADVARHYKLDAAYTSIAGYSMGGYGTFKLGEQFPDLFARAQPTVGISADNDLVKSLRNIPVLMWNADTDELVPAPEYLATAKALDDAGYRYELNAFTGEHLTLALNDEYTPAASFLGTTKVDRDPAHVTYVADPKLDYAKYGFVGNHAYWLSGITARDAGGKGTVDVRSRGFGVGDPPASATAPVGGTLAGGSLGTLAYAGTTKTWGAVPRTAKEDVLDVTATNVAAVTIDAPRARVDCAAKVNLKSDGPTQVTLTGCESGQLPSNRHCVDTRKFSFRLHQSKGARTVKVAAYVNGKRKLLRKGHSLKHLTLRRLPQKTFRVTIVNYQSTGSKLVSTRTYRGCTKSKPHSKGYRHRKKRR